MSSIFGQIGVICPLAATKFPVLLEMKKTLFR